MTVDRTDPYAALGLNQYATQDQIRRAYRALLRQHHPDTRPVGDPADDAASDTMLQQVLAAYAAIGDPRTRAGHDHADPPPTTIPTARRSATPVRRPATDEPPIQAGPVHWLRYRS